MRTSERMITVLDQVLEVALLVNRDMDSSLGDLRLTPAPTYLLWELLHRLSAAAAPGPQREPRLRCPPRCADFATWSRWRRDHRGGSRRGGRCRRHEG